MSADDQVLITNTEDIERIENALKGNSVRNMRRALEKVTRRLIIFERRLIELRSNESIIKARVNNNSDSNFIDKNYTAGKSQTIKPIQSYSRVEGASDPHQYYSYSKFNIHTTALGVQEMDSILNRVNDDIKALQAEIRKYEKTKDKIVKALEDAEAKEKSNRKNTLGQILPPTPKDLEEDKIARSRSANILVLRKIALNYRELSYEPDSEKRVYPDENKLPRQLKILRQIFWSHANAPGLEFDRKEELTYDDPANSKNLAILRDAVGEAWYTARNTKTSLDIDKYVKGVSTIANDPLVSEGIERKPDPTLPSADSLSEKTKSYPGAVLKLGDFYLGSFEIPTFKECIKKWWKKKNAQLYFGLPQCPNVVKPYETTGDVKEENYAEVRSATIIEAEENYRKTLAEAKGAIAEEREKNVGDLPDDAPDWVKTYAETYGTSSRGSIDYGGGQALVTRATDDNQSDALDSARGLVTFPPDSETTESASYTYLSTKGYLVTFNNNRQQFVYPADKENFDENVNASTIKSSEEQTEWVAYILWS